MSKYYLLCEHCNKEFEVFFAMTAYDDNGIIVMPQCPHCKKTNRKVWMKKIKEDE